jgi:PhnB protein
LVVGETQLLISDEIMNTDQSLRVGNSMSLCIESKSLETIQAIYHSLASDDQVKIIIPLAQNLFSPGYGSVEDPFGVLIQLSTEY